MKKNRETFLDEFLSRRVSFIELFFSAILIALGINLITSFLEKLIGSPQLTLFLGIVLFICPLIFYYIRRLLKQGKYPVKYSGFIIYDCDTKKIISISKSNIYDFMFQSCQYFEDVLKSSKTLMQNWQDKEALNNVIKDDGRFSVQLVRDMVEYFALWKLSEYLTEYFDEFRDSGKTKVQEFNHTKLSKIIDNNHCVETYSQKQYSHSFHQLSLKLPKESQIERDNEDARAVIIKLDKCSLKIKSLFYGSFPAVTEKIKYLTKKSNIQCFRVDIEIDVTYDSGIMLIFGSRLERYRWIDGFLDHLDTNFSESVFFDSIKWASTQIVLENLTNNNRQMGTTGTTSH